MTMKSKSMLNVSLCCMALSVVLLAAGCDSAEVGNWFGAKPPYAVKVSTLAFGGRMSVMPIYWIDNDRVLFPGYAVEKRRNDEGKEVLRGSPPGVYIWNTKDNTFERHAGLSEPNWTLCFNKGFLAYSTKSQGKYEYGERYVIKAGMLGHEVELRTDIDWFKNPELKQCDEPKAEVRPEHRDAAASMLHPSDGYIYIGRPQDPNGHGIDKHNQNDQVKFYRPRRAEPIVLPILAKEMDYAAKVTFSEYAGKYVIIPSTWRSRDVGNSVNTWPSNAPIPVYLLSPEGKTETIDIPYGTWGKPSIVLPTKVGLFIGSNNAPNANSAQAGGWLLRDGKMVKVFNHLVDGAGVSPDGCKIAYANNDFNPKTTEYVSVIELCK